MNLPSLFNRIVTARNFFGLIAAIFAVVLPVNIECTYIKATASFIAAGLFFYAAIRKASRPELEWRLDCTIGMIWLVCMFIDVYRLVLFL